MTEIQSGTEMQFFSPIIKFYVAHNLHSNNEIAVFIYVLIGSTLWLLLFCSKALLPTQPGSH